MLKRPFTLLLLLSACLSAVPVFAQQSGPTIVVRAGSHGNYDRVVFDWPRSVNYRVSHEGTHASITFDSLAVIKFPGNIGTEISRAQNFATHTTEGASVTVSFTVNNDTVLKPFTNEQSVVLDIQGKAVVPGTAPAEEPKKAAAPSASKETVTDKPITLLLPSAPQVQPPAPPQAAAKITAPQPAPKTAAPAPQPPQQIASKVSADKPTPAPQPDQKIESAPQAAPAAKAQAAPALPTLPKAAAPTFNFTLSDTPTLVATLDPHIRTRAAIFLRAGYAYIVFDQKLTFSPSAILDGPALIDLQSFDLPKDSAYRFPVPPTAALQATLDGTGWKIYLLKKQANAMPVSTSLVAQPDFALGARFLLPLPDVPDPIRMTDPIVGDDLILVPLAQSEAFNVERRMAELTILPAAQGLVIKPLTDKIIVRAVSDGIEITSEGGLGLSRATDTGASRQSSGKMKAAAMGKSIFDFAAWSGKFGETFSQTRQRLQQTIVDVPEAERNRARLELARFYFAKGEGEEAVSLLNYLAKQVPDLRAHADFMALLGAAEILAYHSEDGLRDLSQPSLNEQPEIGLWQAAAFAQMRDWQHAEEKFSTKESILTGYPEPFFSRFFVLAIESALAANQDHEAADWLHYVTDAKHSDQIDPALNFLRGMLDARAGRANSAETAWKEAQQSNDRLYKVRAELALIDLHVSNGSLTPAQAADRLEALRFGWRGDDLEVDILHRLGQFYIQAKNIKTGINTLSMAVTLYPQSPLAPAIKAEMMSTFRDIFLGSMGKKLSPLDALALYNQYRDLLPQGADGNMIMIGLSERLVAVDLLDQASNILEDLVKNHLQGEDKERAILRLAGIRLLDHKPSDALTSLDLFGNAQLSPAVQNERVLLRARALSEMNKEDDANALLKDNVTPGALMLRADIAMRSQKWGDAAKILSGLVGSPPPKGVALSPEQAGWLMNAAISYALANDQSGLDKLAIDYGDAMSTLPQNGTFQMLTQPEKSGQLRDLTSVQAQLSQVDMFQGFLNTYRTSASGETSEKK